MKYLCAALLIVTAFCGIDGACAKETCTHTWGKGNFKTFRQVQEELRAVIGEGKIIRLSLCAGASDHYFQVTILEPSGKVVVINLAALAVRPFGNPETKGH